MPRRKQELSEVAKEWQCLAFPEEPLSQEERERRVVGLYNRCLDKGEWVVSFHDAGLATILAVPFTFRKMEWEEAILQCRRYLDFARKEEQPRDPLLDATECWLGLALLNQGEIENGIEALEDLLRNIRPRGPYGPTLVRNEMLRASHTLPEPPDPRVLAFLSRAFTKWPKMPRLSPALGEAKSWEEIRMILESSFPRR